MLATLAAFAALTGQAHSENEPCNAYDGWEAIAETALTHTIFFAELHGTAESPDAVRGLICELVAQGILIRYGIETAETQSAALDAALSEPFDRAKVKAAAPLLWSGHDGHSSEAQYELLRYLAALRAKGTDVSVFAFVDGDTPERRDLGHESTMAINIDNAAEAFDGAVIVLIGNSHAVLNPDGIGRTGGSAASEITVRDPLVLSMRYQPGTIWTMMFNGSGEAIPPPQSITRGLGPDSPKRVFTLGSKTGYESGYYYTGPITASPPAFPGD